MYPDPTKSSNPIKSKTNNSSTKVRASPNQVLGSNTRSFDRRTNQTASRDVNPPTKFATAQILIIQKGNQQNKHSSRETQRVLNKIPGGAEDGNPNGDGDTDGGEGVRRHVDESASPGARTCKHGGAGHDDL